MLAKILWANKYHIHRLIHSSGAMVQWLSLPRNFSYQSINSNSAQLQTLLVAWRRFAKAWTAFVGKPFHKNNHYHQLKILYDVSTCFLNITKYCFRRYRWKLRVYFHWSCSHSKSRWGVLLTFRRYLPAHCYSC